MKQLRNLGSKGSTVGAVGYGAMGLEGYYGSTDEENANAAEIVLNPETVQKISELAAPGLAKGQTLL